MTSHRERSDRYEPLIAPTPAAKVASAVAGGAEAPTEPLSQLRAATELRSSELRAFTQEFDDDRNSLRNGDRPVLIVENDLTFAALLLEVVRNRGFKGVIATRGTHALNLARDIKPVAITLDILLPDCSGFSVLERLKRDPQTSHIPVHVISIAEERTRALALGAATFTQKTSGRHALAEIVDSVRHSLTDVTRNVLVVSDSEEHRLQVVDIIGNGAVQTEAVASIADAVAACAMKKFDCIVATPRLEDGSVAELIERIQALQHDTWVRVIVFAADPIAPEINARLSTMNERLVVRCTDSPGELLEIAAIFLHRDETQLSAEKQKMLAEVRQHDPKLVGKKVLIADDDARNIFAITSALERAKIEVVYAENGRVALEKLAEHSDIDLVLMDIMMPEMDGYEATRTIRQIERFRALPVIAVTAKAMLGDREKCIEAGASDYLPKPVDLDQLFSLLRVWLPDRKTTAAAAASTI